MRTVTSYVPQNGITSLLTYPLSKTSRPPMFTGEEFTKTSANADKQGRVIFAVLSASGARIREPLGLEVRHFNGNTITGMG
jgi:hypothetical protein